MTNFHGFDKSGNYREGSRWAATGGAESSVELGDTGPEDEIATYTVSSKTELKKALADFKKSPSRRGEVEWRFDQKKSARGGEDDVHVSLPDGKVLKINVFSGLPQLRIDSGRAIVVANSTMGNSITANPGSRVHVISNSTDTSARKITVDVPSCGPDALRLAQENQAGNEQRISELESKNPDRDIRHEHAMRVSNRTFHETLVADLGRTVDLPQGVVTHGPGEVGPKRRLHVIRDVPITEAAHDSWGEPRWE